MPFDISDSSTGGTLGGSGDRIAAILAANPSIKNRQLLQQLLAEYGINVPDSALAPDPPVIPPIDSDLVGAPGGPAGGFDPSGGGLAANPSSSDVQNPQADAQNLLQTLEQNIQQTSALLEKIIQMLQAQNQLLQDLDKRLTDLAGQVKSLKNP